MFDFGIIEAFLDGPGLSPLNTYAWRFRLKGYDGWFTVVDHGVRRWF